MNYPAVVNLLLAHESATASHVEAINARAPMLRVTYRTHGNSQHRLKVDLSDCQLYGEPATHHWSGEFQQALHAEVAHSTSKVNAQQRISWNAQRDEPKRAQVVHVINRSQGAS